MIVINGYPPNYDEILAAFPGAAGKGVIFCYGDKIYAPGRDKVGQEFHQHEKVHALQQGTNPAAWWRLYIKDPSFRLRMEIPAHWAEWKYLTDGQSRQVRRKHLSRIAKKLSSSLYGKLISVKDAKEQLRRLGRPSAQSEPGSWDGAVLTPR